MMDQGQLLRLMLSLLFILALLLALAWVARRRGWLHGASRASRIQVISTQRLGARCAVTLVQVEGARLILGVTPQQITLLHRLAATGDIDGRSNPERFAATLDRTITKS